MKRRFVTTCIGFAASMLVLLLTMGSSAQPQAAQAAPGVAFPATALESQGRRAELFPANPACQAIQRGEAAGQVFRPTANQTDYQLAVAQELYVNQTLQRAAPMQQAVCCGWMMWCDYYSCWYEYTCWYCY